MSSRQTCVLYRIGMMSTVPADKEAPAMDTTPPPIVPREHVKFCGVCGSTERAPFYQPADVVECQGCRVLYVSPRPTAEAIAQFYSMAGRYAHWDRQPGRKAMWERRVKRIHKLVPGGNLLDVGTGQGDFGAQARRYFSFEGTEISLEGARMARERYGLTVHEGELMSIELPKQRYDAITLWHVLEHVGDPRVVVNRCIELLKPGGVLAIAVPNTDWDLALTKRALNATWKFAFKREPDRSIGFPRLYLQDPEEEIHLTHFTLGTLTWLLRSAGLTIVEQGIDDHAAEDDWEARKTHYKYELFYRMSGFVSAPAIFAAARKSGE